MKTNNYLSFDALTLAGIDLLTHLNNTLQSELIALTERDLQQITQCAVQKSQFLADFSENTHQRSVLLENIKLNSDKENVQLFLNSCPDTHTKNNCKTNWKILEEILQATIDANNVNEQVLKRNKKNIDTILSILQGKQANNILYDVKGDKGDYTGQSRLGKA
ncbi:MAG: flagellar export chaperone FlgN [Oceanospirillaceae bacterium]